MNGKLMKIVLLKREWSVWNGKGLAMSQRLMVRPFYF